MEGKTSIENLYTMVLRDVNIVIEIVSNQFLKDGASKEKMKKELENKIEKLNIKELYDNCAKFLNEPLIINAIHKSHPEINDLLIKYLEDIKDLLEEKDKDKNFPTIQANEQDIYRAYGFLSEFRLIFVSPEVNEVSRFNYKEFTYFDNFLRSYGNSNNLGKNYSSNFAKYKGDKELKIELIYKWLAKVNNRELNPMEKNDKKKKKKEKRKKKKEKSNDDDTNGKSNLKEMKENHMEDILNDDNQANQKEMNTEDDKKSLIEKNINIIKIEDKNSSIINEKENKKILLNDDNKNMDNGNENIILSATKTKNSINKSSVKNNLKLLNKNKGDINGEISKAQSIKEENNEIISSQLFNNNEIKSDKDIFNSKQLSTNNEIKDNLFSTEKKGEENNIGTFPKAANNNEIKNEKEIYNNNPSSDKELLKDLSNTTENKEESINKIITSNEIRNEKIMSNNIQSNKESENNIIELLKKEMNELKEIIEEEKFQREKEMNELKDKIEEEKNQKEKEMNELKDKIEEEKNQRKKEMNELKEKIEEEKNQKEKEMNELTKGLNERITKLEINQLLLYHQINMFQTSRDMYKSISYFYYDVLHLKGFYANKFERLKAIMEFLEDKNTLKTGKTPIIPQDFKKKLGKYFKLHFFVNKVRNKIINRNFEEDEQRILEQQKDNELLSLIPSFDFDQCFDSLIYYIENSSKNKQLQTAMRIIYEQKYINDEELELIRDINQEVIKKDENGISFLMEKNEIEEVKNYFKSIYIGQESFDKKFNDMAWD